ncbi:MAG: TorF family putative porin [Porticoccaceae bacterium]
MRKYLGSLIVTVMALHLPDASAELGGSLTLVNDYRARGVSQSGEKPAVQGWIEYFHKSGVYVGWWGSNLDYYHSSDPFDNRERVEHDLYIGYFNQLNENLSYDFTYYEYFITGAKADVDFNEVALGVDYYDLRMVYWYTNDTFNTGEDYSYVEADYRVALPLNLGLTFHVGHSFGSALDLAVFGFEEYFDYSLTVDKHFAGLDLEIAYSDTNIRGNSVINNNYSANQSALIFSVAKKF